MSDRALIERLYDRQVCSPAQNACRNDDRLDAAIEALAASEARVDSLEKALQSAIGYMTNASIDISTGAPKATAIKAIEGGIKATRAALNGETK